MIIALDFGLSNLDVILYHEDAVKKHWTRKTPASITTASLQVLFETLAIELTGVSSIAVTGGRYRDLPEHFEGLAIHKVSEPCAIGRGGLALSQLSEALVVSTGTGTAMVKASQEGCQHVSGSAVGGGTLQGLGQLLLGISDPLEISQLAKAGDSSGVDTTLGDVLGGGVGQLPASATAVNFGRLVTSSAPRKEDIAAGLCNMIAQTIALIALNATQAQGLAQTIFTGRLAQLRPIKETIQAVWQVYQQPTSPHFPEDSALATALGAALEAQEQG